jgi:hypothetical protein
MRYLIRCGRLAVLALIAGLALCVVGATTSYAAEEGLGESGFSAENIGFGTAGGPVPIATPNASSSAWVSGSNGRLILVRSWRGIDGQVWTSINSGQAFVIRGAQTNVQDAVIPLGQAGAAIFHTGTDNHIYYSYTFDAANATNGNAWSPWQQVPGATTSLSPSVQLTGNAPGQQGGSSVLVAYRGLTNQNVYTTFNSDIENAANWGQSTQVPGALTNFAPSIRYLFATSASWRYQQEVNLVITGTNGHLYYTYTPYGSNSWRPLVDITSSGAASASAPTMTATTNDILDIAYTTPNRTLAFIVGSSQNTFIPFASTTGWQTNGSGPSFEENSGANTVVVIAGQNFQAYEETITNNIT